MKKWITCSELCSRWGINKYDLAEIVNDGKLRSYNKDRLEICMTGDGYFVDSPDGGPSTLIHEPLTVDEVAELIFRISVVEEYERINGMNPHVMPTAGRCDATSEPSEKEAAEFSAAFGDAEVELEQKDKRNYKLKEKELLEKQIPKGIKESIQKAKRLKEIDHELETLQAPKRPCQKHRLMARKWAKKIWSSYPNYTIQEMAECDEIHSSLPREYRVRTIRNWINDLAPNRLPGRRKNTDRTEI